MIIKIILAHLILLVSLVGHGQQHGSVVKEKWQIELGYQNFRVLDKNVSPLIYASNNGIIGFKYERIKANTLWNLETSLSLGNNQSKRFGYREAVVYDHFSIHGYRDSSIYTINPKLSFIQCNLTYSYYWKLGSQEMHLGGQLHDTFVYGALGADVWFFNQLSIMPSCQIKLLRNPKSDLVATISAPLVSYLLRQPYTLDPSLPEHSYLKAYLKTGSAIASINKFQQLNIKLNYHFVINQGNKLGISYQFMCMNYANLSNRNLKAYSNSLLIAYLF